MSGPFAKTTFGPPAPTGLDTDKGALIADVLNGVVDMVDMNGNVHTLGAALNLLQAQTALTNVTSAQPLFSIPLPAGAMNKKNRALQIQGFLIATVGAGTPTVTIAIKLGGTTIFTITTAALAVSTNLQIFFDVLISVVTTGATGTVEAHGQVTAQLSAALGTAVAQYQDQNIAPSSAIDLTAAQSLGATIAASGTVASVQLRNALIEVVG
jgi:hypothetical protein